MRENQYDYYFQNKKNGSLHTEGNNPSSNETQSWESLDKCIEELFLLGFEIDLEEKTVTSSFAKNEETQIESFSESCFAFIKKDQTHYSLAFGSKEPGNTLSLIRQNKIPPAEPIPAQGIYARTFGRFDLFVDGLPVFFPSRKEKELLAIIIDRAGGFLASSEGAEILWCDSPKYARDKNRYRKLCFNLQKTLEEYGAQSIIVSKNGSRRVNLNAFQCDYYEYRKGSTSSTWEFREQYMQGYSWATIPSSSSISH